MVYRFSREPAWVPPPIDYTHFSPEVAEQVRKEVERANAEAGRMWLEDVAKYRSGIARLGGLATKGISTPRKRKTSAENGRKGGRPPGRNFAKKDYS